VSKHSVLPPPPLQAMSWWHHYQHSSMVEAAAVYWLAPFAGALLGGLIYRSARGGLVRGEGGGV